jgi:glycosyltransferase involved in cell wall biosynthesis
MSIKLSVIIPTYNKAKLLEKTIHALLGQDLNKSDWEVVVVDDGSSDNTKDVLNSFLNLSEYNFKVASPDGNIGRARARNFGADSAVGKWLLFLDDDIIAPPELLSGHLSMLEADGDFGLIGLVATSEDVIDAPHFYYIDSRGAAKISKGYVPGKYLVTQNCSVPREMFIDVGGFDEKFSAYGFEDMDLGLRLCNAGLKFKLLKNPVPVHVHHHTLSEYLRKKQECGFESIALVAKKHPAEANDMKLNWVIGSKPGMLINSFRIVASSALYGYLVGLAGMWPVAKSEKPLFCKLYFKLLDFLVMASFYRGYKSS